MYLEKIKRVGVPTKKYISSHLTCVPFFNHNASKLLVFQLSPRVFLMQVSSTSFVPKGCTILHGKKWGNIAICRNLAGIKQ